MDLDIAEGALSTAKNLVIALKEKMKGVLGQKIGYLRLIMPTMPLSSTHTANKSVVALHK